MGENIVTLYLIRYFCSEYTIILEFNNSNSTKIWANDLNKNFSLKKIYYGQ